MTIATELRGSDLNAERSSWREKTANDSFITGSIGVLIVLCLGGLGLLLTEPSQQMDPRETSNIRIWLVLALVAIGLLWVLVVYVRLQRHKIHMDSPSRDIADKLFRESRAMAGFALERGLRICDGDLKAISDAEAKITSENPDRMKLAKTLSPVHARLSVVVAPAVPKSLMLLEGEPPLFPWLGTVRLVRMMVGIVVVLIPLFVGLGISVGSELSATQGLFGGDVVEKIQTATYLVVAAAVGAAFAALTKATRFIGNLSYDDKYESSYWVRFILGVVAGLVLAIILSQVLFTNSPAENAGFRITVPLLALVGGFSDDLVYRILKRVIEAVETLVRGSTSERVRAAEQEMESRLRTKEIESRHKIVTKLIDLRDSLPDDATEARKAAEAMITETLGSAVLVATPDGSDDEE